jgi:hypothetical protein
MFLPKLQGKALLALDVLMQPMLTFGQTLPQMRHLMTFIGS